MKPELKTNIGGFRKIMISYAWDLQTPDHHLWVEKLYRQLDTMGFNVTLDKFSVPYEGRPDLFLWIERSVKNADWIIAIITEKYVSKCDDRDGANNSLGYEIQQIIAKFIRTGLQDRVICLLRHKTSGVDKTPSFLPNAYFVDFTDEAKFQEKFDELINIFSSKQNSSLTELKSVEANNQTNQTAQDLTKINLYQWKINTAGNVFHCKNNPSLEIHLVRERGWKVLEKWAVDSLGAKAYRVRVALKVNGKEHEVFNFAATDQQRFLPFPKVENGQLEITWLADKIGVVLNGSGEYENLKSSIKISIL